MELPNDIASCHEIIISQSAQIAELTSRLSAQSEAQSEQIAELLSRIAILEAQLSKNSRNSNKPPSSDGLKKQAALPRKLGKKRGGQQGHKGKKLEFVSAPEAIDERIALYPEASHCTCGTSLDKRQAERQELRQEFDLPEARLFIRQYEQYQLNCPGCGKVHQGAFPAHIRATTQYGTGVKTLTTMLHEGFALPLRKIKTLFSDLFGYAINDATILNYQATCYELMAEQESAHKSALRASDLAHCDETGIRVEGKLHWLHVFANEVYTYFFVHPKRGKAALDDTCSLLPNYAGWVVHDSWASYFKYPSAKHALCGAHILRELYALEEQGSLWAKHFRRYFLAVLSMVKSNDNCLNTEQSKKALRLYEKICAYADETEPESKKIVGKKGRTKNSKGRNLLNRLVKYQSAVLAFAFHEEVPFTNNLAERDLRPFKTKLKITGGFRSLEGAKRHARIFGFIASMRKQGKNVFQEIKALFQETNPKIA